MTRSAVRASERSQTALSAQCGTILATGTSGAPWLPHSGALPEQVTTVPAAVALGRLTERAERSGKWREPGERA